MRPEHLPDFASPPLDEVVIGVQFAPPPNYTSVRSKDVWDLFKDDYPIVQEVPPLEPSFETFGGAMPQSGMRFQIGPSPLRGRLWFVSSEQNHLLQFQDDRFLLNWRSRPNGQEYPRFESISEPFESYLGTLQNFFANSFETKLDINQAELTYINIVPVEKFSCVCEWFSFLGFKNIDVEGINVQFTEVVSNQEGKPYARMFYELQSLLAANGKEKIFKLAFTFRGKPSGKEISDVMTFMRDGREKIVNRFSELTTDKAHAQWRRNK